MGTTTLFALLAFALSLLLLMMMITVADGFQPAPSLVQKPSSSSSSSSSWSTRSRTITTSIVTTTRRKATTRQQQELEHQQRSYTAMDTTTTTDNHQPRPVRDTILFDFDNQQLLPFRYELDDNVVYKQRCPTSLLIQGKHNLVNACNIWDTNLQMEFYYDGNDTTAPAIKTNIQKASTISPTTAIIQWNISYVNPNTKWLADLAALGRWKLDYNTYNDQKYSIKTFSYLAILKLFQNAFQTRTLRIPQVCIEGTTIYEFKQKEKVVNTDNANDNNDTVTKRSQRVVSTITEDLIYAPRYTTNQVTE